MKLLTTNDHLTRLDLQSWTPVDGFVTIGVREVHVYELFLYYAGIQRINAFSHKALMVLCKEGMEAVKKQRFYKRQIDVDRVFFAAAKKKAYSSVLNIVLNWQDVYRQLSTSHLPFRKLFLFYWFGGLHPQDFKKFIHEFKAIKSFFVVMGMNGAAFMVQRFIENFEWFNMIGVDRLSEKYPFALNGHPHLIAN